MSEAVTSIVRAFLDAVADITTQQQAALLTLFLLVAVLGILTYFLTKLLPGIHDAKLRRFVVVAVVLMMAFLVVPLSAAALLNVLGSAETAKLTNLLQASDSGRLLLQPLEDSTAAAENASTAAPVVSPSVQEAVDEIAAVAPIYSLFGASSFADPMKYAARSSFYSNDPEAAQQLMSKVIELEPSAVNWNDLGIVSRKRAYQQQPPDRVLLEQALEEFSRALAVDAQNGKALNNRGLTEIDLGRTATDEASKERYYQAAESDLQAAKNILPNSPAIQLNIATLLEQNGRIPAAVDAYRKTIELDGQNYKALNNLANLLATEESVLQPSQAVELSKRAVELAPNNPAYRDTLARSLFAAGEASQARDEAVRALREAKAINAPYVGETERLLQKIDAAAASQ